MLHYYHDDETWLLRLSNVLFERKEPYLGTNYIYMCSQDKLYCSEVVTWREADDVRDSRQHSSSLSLRSAEHPNPTSNDSDCIQPSIRPDTTVVHDVSEFKTVYPRFRY